MFCPLEYRENVLIIRGLLILIVVIVIGIAVSEEQLNDLTQREDRIPVFHMQRKQSGVYGIYILGASYHLRAVYEVGQIINTNKTIIIQTAKGSVTIPEYLEFDCRKELAFLDLEARLLVEEAFKYKKKIQLYLNDIRQKINVYAV